MTEIGDLEYTTYNMLVNNIDVNKEKNITIYKQVIKYHIYKILTIIYFIIVNISN